ncbi:PREDICTED: protein TONSOKU [Nelumbo nucifera]|uniref:Protein TONSOKU n=2 Tax=Nelumbo nucifera TaxID=4432 RepID=A0A1U7Z4T8_NELNU|nr:PREDICTED: protein TONSOKU [Nelumbo nucifera]DAD40000.1 TPA_asm: hypothetical protein HUJ06_014323 [Nelumbo nucifera]
MARDDVQLSAAKRAYKHAVAEGNRQEEARWANVIGDILKNRGEYVKALKWLRIDYEVSSKYLPEKQLLPTCQSLGEVYLRLEYFKDALIYQKKHLELAKDTSDLIEQQRASTQLGRTYHELFLRSDGDHLSVRNAKKYFQSAMKLARTLKENRPPNKTSFFLKEFIDAHNNIGMLEMDLDNLEEAQRILLDGLEICDEEEVNEYDDARSRLHHNLGSIYMELRMWDTAKVHIEKDIQICEKIEHYQGEAKGYINLGELHYRVQKYEEAINCYQKALKIAKSMEDEDALVDQIGQNIETVKEAIKVMDELRKEEQNLKKLTRAMAMARGTPGERKCLLDQNASLDRLIEKSSMIFAWLKHREFAKRKKRVATELCDKEKLSDSFLVIGESYQKLRNFSKALKWYKKSWDTYRSIGNLEGQALAKINIGDVLDSDGDWAGALEAFEEGYSIAVKANLPSAQISALENMHYSHMIRFDNVEEAKRLQLVIDKLKCSTKKDNEACMLDGDCCSETETKGNDDLTDTRSNACSSPMITKSVSVRIEEIDEDLPLISLLQSRKNFSKPKGNQLNKPSFSTVPTESSPKSLSKSISSHQPVVGRKRVRVVLSDDERDEHNEIESPRGRNRNCPVEDVATSDDIKNNDGPAGLSREFQNVTPCIAFKDPFSACTLINVEESACSYKSGSPKVAAKNGTGFRSSSTRELADTSNFGGSGSKVEGDCIFSDLQKQNGANFNLLIACDEYNKHVIVKIDDNMIRVDPSSCMDGDKLSVECMKVEVACLYYLQLSEEKRAKGLFPIIRHMKYGGKALDSLEDYETIKHHIRGRGWIEVAIDGWVQKRLMKLYIDFCKKLSEAPNMKLLRKLYNLEVSEDEVIVSECELQDISVTPLLDALHEHKTIALLDLSHNLLGNETMEKLHKIFKSSSQKYGGLTLDLHCNRFGPTALFQICECPVLLSRLEVLNISGNRLTDACASYLSTILENCKALYSLNIECCSITSRTIQKVADALHAGSVLSQFSLGNNNPISGNAMASLLTKLSTLKRFSELNLNGIKFSKFALDSLCQLAKSSCLSVLMLGSTSIGSDGALQLTEALSNGPQEMMKLDLSYCGLTSNYFVRLSEDFLLIGGIIELNLAGNSTGQEGANAIASLLMNPQCCLKVLLINKCILGLAGILQIVQALAENNSLEELNLAENVNLEKDKTIQYDLTATQNSKSAWVDNRSQILLKICVAAEVDAAPQGLDAANADYNHLEVADSEDGLNKAESIPSALDDSCTSSCHKNPPLPECEFVQELSMAIGMAKQLHFIDLSNNGFTVQAAETLYTAWSSSSRCGGATTRHIKDLNVHFSVEGRNCCGVKNCCKRD